MQKNFTWIKHSRVNGKEQKGQELRENAYLTLNVVVGSLLITKGYSAIIIDSFA